MTLYIDATDFNTITYVLKSANKEIKKSFKVAPHQSFKMLEELDEFLSKSKISITKIKQITVNKGPGSFTGVRVSLAHAQALALAWKVPLKVLANESFKKRSA